MWNPRMYYMPYSLIQAVACKPTLHSMNLLSLYEKKECPTTGSWSNGEALLVFAQGVLLSLFTWPDLQLIKNKLQESTLLGLMEWTSSHMKN
mmetsp:Transcript_67117/g.112357  ORF Transcript_67117/g.112357 Transcript_67117/m.112357 type:complete len:92 (-) Transcript_67117:50-325(-)